MKVFAVFLTILLFSSCREEAINIGQVRQKVEQILEVPGYEYVFKQIIHTDQSAYLLSTIRLFEKSTLFSINYHIQAGYDLSEGFNFRADGDTALVFLPAVKILSAVVDESSIREYFSSTGFGSFSHEEIRALISEGREAIIQEAIDKGIKTLAEQNSRRLIRNLLVMAGFDAVIFRPFEQEWL